MSTYPEVAEYALDILRRADLLDDGRAAVDWTAFDRVEPLVHDRFRIPATTCTLVMAHFLFAAGAARRPASIVGAGTYVGYMLAWLVAGARSAAGGRVPATVGLDVDAEAGAIAERNFRDAGLHEGVTFVTADACQACGDIEGVDLLLLDIDETERRKHRYADVLEAAAPNLTSGALVLAHDPLVPLFSDDMRRFDEAVAADGRLAGPVVLPLDECGITVVTRL